MRVIFGVIFLLYLLGAFFPEALWNFNYFHYLKPFHFLILCGICLLFFSALKLSKNLNLRKFHLLGISIISVPLFYYFPIIFDVYGDSTNYRPYLNQVVTDLPPTILQDLFSFDFRPASSRKFLLAILSLTSYSFKVTYETAFRITDALCGSLFLYCWMSFVCRSFTQANSRLTMTLLGVSSPFLLIFFGHIDTYSFVYIAILTWLLCFAKIQSQPSGGKFLLFFLTFLLLIKIHPITLLFLPLVLLSGVDFFLKERKVTHFLFSQRGLLTAVLLPIFISGFILYFFIFKDHNDERLLQNVTDFERLFLPIFSPPPPLDRYNLFSINHIVDFLNIVLSWSPAALFLTGILLLKRNTLGELLAYRDIKLLLLSLFLFTCFLFAINPLISMPMDWDLFSIPALILIVLMLIIFKKAKASFDWKKMSPYAILFFVLNLPVFMVNNNKTMLSQRLETLGRRIYKTYYEHSTKYIHLAIGLSENEEIYMQRKHSLIKDLSPYALQGNDVKFAMFHTDNGIMYKKIFNKPNSALKEFKKAQQYAPYYEINNKELIELYFEKKQYALAYQQALKLEQNAYPNRERALQIVLHCAVFADLYEEVIRANNELLKVNPQNELANIIHEKIDRKATLSELKVLFQAPGS